MLPGTQWTVAMEPAPSSTMGETSYTWDISLPKANMLRIVHLQGNADSADSQFWGDWQDYSLARLAGKEGIAESPEFNSP